MALDALRKYAESQNLISNVYIKNGLIADTPNTRQTVLEEENFRKAELLKIDILKKIEEKESSDKIIDDCIKCISLLSNDTTYQDKVSDTEKIAFIKYLF